MEVAKGFRFRPIYLLAIPVMLTAPLHWSAAKFQPKLCAFDPRNAISRAEVKGQTIQYAEFLGVPQENPLSLWYQIAAFACLSVPPSLIIFDSLRGVKFGQSIDDEDEADDELDDEPVDKKRSGHQALKQQKQRTRPTEASPSSVLFGEDDESADDDFDDFDRRLGSQPSSVVADESTTSQWLQQLAKATGNMQQQTETEEVA